ncbi:hypothetical protein San01_55790 [Streptomyces angustmyceticus]|uniref:Uncharacterized protein n=1 Tax=Streptomyces angustmyceticus TaxID=285578 RepID=A0A5J4LM39_9ACTN|nr:hypothetical protein San01_55790 [Streptomyces angustmyceticus]
MPGRSGGRGRRVSGGPIRDVFGAEDVGSSFLASEAVSVAGAAALGPRPRNRLGRRFVPSPTEGVSAAPAARNAAAGALCWGRAAVKRVYPAQDIRVSLLRRGGGAPETPLSACQGHAENERADSRVPFGCASRAAHRRPPDPPRRNQ